MRKVFWCAPLAALALLGGCTTVDLNQGRYNPPPVRMPGQSVEVAQPQPQGAPLGEPMDTPVSTPVSTPVVMPADTPVGASPDVQGTAYDARVALMTDMTGASAVPATPSGGSGHIDMMFNRETNVLRWKTTWGGLDGAITGVQFHGPAPAGQTAPAVMIWPAPFGPTYEGRATLSEQQAYELLQGLWYVNVQTSAYPAGEIRGQLRVVE
ncbi:MAG: CHRD domain-containing protein [Ottowia sp.]|nr:CHRD domain-containing protein [Ottowia sp.]